MPITQIYEHRLNVLKAWPSMDAVDVALEADTGVTVYPGMVCYKNPATGKAALGCPAGQVPLFCVLTGNREGVDTDSYREDYQFGSGVTVVGTGVAGDVGAEKTGAKCGFIYGIYPFEAESTEFVGVSGDFPNDQPLMSPTSGGNAGKLVPATTPASDPVIGLISSKSGVYPDAHRTSVVRFINLPGVARPTV